MYKKTIFLTILFFSSALTLSHADLRNGLVGWWKFDEASGNAIDSSSSGKNGTPSGTTIVANCKRSGCRSFNGTSDYVGSIGSTSTYAFIQNTMVYTISLWVKIASVTTRKILLANTLGSAEKGFFIVFENGAGVGTKAVRMGVFNGTSGDSTTGRTPDNIIIDSN